MKALLLGAGYGTRLYPLTKNRPKPLLNIGRKPMVEWILDRLLPIPGLNGIALVTNSRFAENFEDWRKSYRSPVPVAVYNDGTTSNEDRLGAVGDIQFTIREGKIDDDLLVVAGDNLFEFDVAKMVAFGREKGGPVVCLKDMQHAGPLISQYSVVTLDANRRITDFEEKPARPKTSLISICLYYFPKATLPLVDRYLASGHNKDQPGWYIQWLVKQVPTFGYVIDGLWFDIGDIDSYDKANEIFEKR
ncbi:MAG: glucose-1-phosphate [Planctomycetota bacterium]|nr:MAG: glucose-1-phosphate [Planctomycetota bacterium]